MNKSVHVRQRTKGLSCEKLLLEIFKYSLPRTRSCVRRLIAGHLKNSFRRFSEAINNLKLELAALNCLKKAIKSPGARDCDKHLLSLPRQFIVMMASGISVP